MLTFGPVKVERWKPDESAACAYLRADKLILHGSCITTVGDLACEPCRVLPAGAEDAELGAALLDVLAAAKIAAPPPIDSKVEEQMIMAAAGVRSWKQFHKGAVNCCISMTPQQITILPTRNEGRAFFHVPEHAIRLLVGSTPEQFGKALREGFVRCT